MPLIDKVGLGLGVFMGFFLVFLVAFPRSAYARYYHDLERRKLGYVVKKLVIGVKEPVALFLSTDRFTLEGLYAVSCGTRPSH